MLTIKSVIGLELSVKLVRQGESYGLNNALKHEDADPLVEFYDKRYAKSKPNFYPEGFFISRYNLSTLLEGNDGLCLDGGNRQYDIDGLQMDIVREWLRRDGKVQIIVLELHSENGDTLNASHAVLPLTPELCAQIQKRIAEFSKMKEADSAVVSVNFEADDPLWLAIDEQIVSGREQVQEITAERFQNICKFSDDLTIRGSSEMRVSSGVNGAEVRLYFYEKHTGQEVYTSEFPQEALARKPPQFA